MKPPFRHAPRRPRAAASLLLLLSLTLGPLTRAGAGAQTAPAGATPPLSESVIYQIHLGDEFAFQTEHYVRRRKNGPAVGIRLESSRGDVLAVSGNKVVGRKVDDDPVLVKVFTFEGRGRPLLHSSYQIKVTLPTARRVSRIDFEGAGVSVTPGKAVIVTATPKNADGATLRESVAWRIVDPGEGKFEYVPGADNRLAVVLTSAASRPSPIVFAARLNGFEQTGVLIAEAAPREQPPAERSKVVTVRGDVLGGGGPVRDVTVALENVAAAGAPPSARTTKTNESGKFAFEGVEANKDYTLRAAGDGMVFTPASHALKPTGDTSYTFSAAAVPSPEPFIKLVDARLDPVDYRMASDLYGNVTNRQFSVRKLQLFNKLAELRNGSFVGDSIVIYADSIKVPVNLEIRYVGPSEVGGVKVSESRRKWHPLELAAAAPDLHLPLDEAAWKKWRDDWSLRRTKVDPQKQPKDGEKLKPEEIQDFACTQNPIYYSPYTLDQMISTANRRDSREWRSLLTTATSGSLTLASFLGTILLPGGTSDLPLIVDKTNNLLLPSFKELLPSSRDANQQNLTREALRPVETIPFKQSVQKMAFFPKKPWKDGRYEYRISHICQEPIQIEAVVAKSGDQLPIHTLGGKVTNAAGEPVPNATVELGGVFVAPRQQTTDNNGRYAFTQLTPGDYTLRAYPPGNKCNLSSTIKYASVTNKATEADVSLPVLRFDIAGRVKKKGGAGVKDAKVVLLGKDGKELAKSPATNEEGVFRFGCQEAGDYKLKVELPGGAAGPQRDVKVTASDVADADVEIEQPKEAGGGGTVKPKGETHHAAPGADAAGAEDAAADAEEVDAEEANLLGRRRAPARPRPRRPRR